MNISVQPNVLYIILFVFSLCSRRGFPICTYKTTFAGKHRIPLPTVLNLSLLNNQTKYKSKACHFTDNWTKGTKYNTCLTWHFSVKANGQESFDPLTGTKPWQLARNVRFLTVNLQIFLNLNIWACHYDPRAIWPFIEYLLDSVIDLTIFNHLQCLRYQSYLSWGGFQRWVQSKMENE